MGNEYSQREMSLSHREKKRFVKQLNSLRVQITSYCRHLLWNSQDLEDAIQEIVAIAFKKYQQFESGTNFKAWMFQIATHTVFNINRRYSRESERLVQLEVEEMDFHHELHREFTYNEILKEPDRILGQVEEEIIAALSVLNVNERAVFLLRSLGELPYGEIAKILDMPLGSVMGYLGRARGKLREALTEYAQQRGILPKIRLVKP